MTRTVLIAGASGVIGQAAIERFAKDGWKVVGASRRAPLLPDDVAFDHLALDLTDPAACATAASQLSGVTHVVYAALFEKPGLVAGWYEADQMQTNLSMMRNLMDPLLASARGLQHVSVLQGTKAYGAHVHRIRSPARESQPRDPHENFYWLQEDYIRDRQAAGDWGLTIWRPQVVFGGALGAAMNLVPVLGVYAALCRELGEPFLCPGVHDNFIEAVDADLMAQALAWAAEAPGARDQIFNITNGDVFAWPNVWPAIAASVGLEPAFGKEVSLASLLPQRAELWDRIVAKHGLRPISLPAVLGESHHYADLLFSVGAGQAPASTLVSTIKIRQAGFGDCIDTEVMFDRWLRRLGNERIIPLPAT